MAAGASDDVSDGAMPREDGAVRGPYSYAQLETTVSRLKAGLASVTCRYLGPVIPSPIAIEDALVEWMDSNGWPGKLILSAVADDDTACIAGGAALYAYLVASGKKDEITWQPSDLDIFYANRKGTDEPDAARFADIFPEDEGWTCIADTHAYTSSAFRCTKYTKTEDASETKPYIQTIAHGFSGGDHAADIVRTFDLDCVCIWTDGTTTFMLSDTHYALGRMLVCASRTFYAMCNQDIQKFLRRVMKYVDRGFQAPDVVISAYEVAGQGNMDTRLQDYDDVDGFVRTRCYCNDNPAVTYFTYKPRTTGRLTKRASS